FRKQYSLLEPLGICSNGIHRFCLYLSLPQLVFEDINHSMASDSTITIRRHYYHLARFHWHLCLQLCSWTEMAVLPQFLARVARISIESSHLYQYRERNRKHREWQGTDSPHER